MITGSDGERGQWGSELLGESQSVRRIRQPTNGAPTLRAGARPARAEEDAGCSRGLCSSYFPGCRLSIMDAAKQVINFGPGPAKLPQSVRWLEFVRDRRHRDARCRDAAVEMQTTVCGVLACPHRDVAAKAKVGSCAETPA